MKIWQKAGVGASLPGPPDEMQFPAGTLEGQRSEMHPPPVPTAPTPVVPEPTPEMLSFARASEDKRRRLEGLPPKHRPRPGPYDPAQASVPHKVAFFEGKEDWWKSLLTDVTDKLATNSSLQRLSAEKDIQF